MTLAVPAVPLPSAEALAVSGRTRVTAMFTKQASCQQHSTSVDSRRLYKKPFNQCNPADKL